MSAKPWIGPTLAAGTAIPAWVIAVVDPPPVVWFNVAVACVHLAFAALVGTWITRHPRGRRWLSDRGATATWLALGGLGAAPAVILQLSTLLAFVALAGLALMLTVLSPVLSERAQELLERLLVPEPEVRPIPKLGALPPPPPASQLVRTVPSSDGRAA